MTESITWITPLSTTMSALTTLAPFTFTPLVRSNFSLEPSRVAASMPLVSAEDMTCSEKREDRGASAERTSAPRAARAERMRGVRPRGGLRRAFGAVGTRGRSAKCGAAPFQTQRGT